MTRVQWKLIAQFMIIALRYMYSNSPLDDRIIRHAVKIQQELDFSYSASEQA